jgi:hypothetical protein
MEADVGGIVVQFREFEITQAEAEKARKSAQDAGEVLLTKVRDESRGRCLPFPGPVHSYPSAGR